MTVISIDPGKKNLGFRIERRARSGGVTTVEVLVYDRVDFTSHQNSSDYSTYYRGISSYLRQYDYLLKNVHVVIIEKQMHSNIDMRVIASHFRSYYIEKLRELPLYPYLIEVSAKMKTNQLTRPGTKIPLEGKKNKDWAVEKALQLSFIRKDWVSFLKIIKEPASKRDDLSDTLVQIEALCKFWKYATTPVPDSWESALDRQEWRSGLIFFYQLTKLCNLNLPVQKKPTLNDWIKVLKSKTDVMIKIRKNNQIDFNTGEWLVTPSYQISLVPNKPVIQHTPQLTIQHTPQHIDIHDVSQSAANAVPIQTLSLDLSLAKLL